MALIWTGMGGYDMYDTAGILERRQGQHLMI
jgi:hypothetical protein